MQAQEFVLFNLMLHIHSTESEEVFNVWLLEQVHHWEYKKAFAEFESLQKSLVRYRDKVATQ